MAEAPAIPAEVAILEDGGVLKITPFRNHLHREYCARPEDNAPTGKVRMESLVLQEIRHYKLREGVEHEYDVAKFVHSTDGHEIFIRVERGGGDAVGHSEGIKAAKGSKGDGPSRAGKARSSGQSSYPSFQLFKTLDANDKVSMPTEWPTDVTPGQDEDRLEARVTFPTTGTNTCKLADLVVLSNTIHVSYPKYKLLSRQCYWYAATVVAILTAHYGGTAVVNNEPATAQETVNVGGTNVPVTGTEGAELPAPAQDTANQEIVENQIFAALEPPPGTTSGADTPPTGQATVKKAGKWKYISVHKEKASLIATLTTQFTTDLAQFHADVSC